MKKLIFTGLVVLLTLSLATCDFTPLVGEKDDGLDNVVYEVDANGNLKGVTLYLEGGVPRTAASRALNTAIAKTGHDFYEVVFMGSTTIVRASWTLGESPALKGIDREGYPTVTDAVLFVGRGDDKTLLAIGELTGVNDPDASTATDITTKTSAVTFTVEALKAGLDVSFDIEDDDGNAISEVTETINGTQYYCYELPYDEGPFIATYSFDTFHDAGIYVARVTTSDDMYENAILTQGRVPVGDGFHSYVEPLQLGATAELTNNNLVGAFEKDIVFEIDTADSSGGYIALTFSIPVYAIDDTAGTGLVDPIEWNIRPGFGGHRYYLDNGAGGLGGAILLNITGVEGQSDTIRIITK